MASLAPDLRRQLENRVVEAREKTEAAARAVLERLAVAAETAPPSLSAEDRALRVALRAKAKQLGNGVRQDGLPLLVEEIAYEQWHRMLFARFLAENSLLKHPTGAVVSLQDCEELAPEEGAADAWELAARYASAMLPGIFRADDPSAQVRFAPEGRDGLERILADLPTSIVKADDALGWVYQFWQSKKKDEVNKSGHKIGGADLSPVTQLFTEDYMVRFLLENSLGAWWAARHPESPLLADFAYLRFREDGTPAAGTFPGWPDRAAEVTVMDPCCGSGHFLVRAFDMLCRMRMEEEELSEAKAADAVLRDNLFGLELDPRCTQIATFALAFASWQVGGHPEHHPPHVACSGLAIRGQLEDWQRLAGSEENLRFALQQLHALFVDAPVLGSLINPAGTVARQGMFAPNWASVEVATDRLLSRHDTGDPARAVFERTAESTARAAQLLSRRYTLVATNVPFLARVKQDDVLKRYAERNHPNAKGDLATVFLERCRAYCAFEGTFCLVTPQNWLSLASYRGLRHDLLVNSTFNMIVPLGPAAFRDMNWWAANTAMFIVTATAPRADHQVAIADVSKPRSPDVKEQLLRELRPNVIRQQAQLENPDQRITADVLAPGELLEAYADAYAGIRTGDYSRFGRCFWEMPDLLPGWVFQLSTVEGSVSYGGRQHLLLWENGQGQLALYQAELAEQRYASGGWKQGWQAWGKGGVAVSQMNNLPVTLHTGELFDNNTAVVVPKDPSHLPAIWTFCSSPEFRQAVRRIDQQVKVTNATLVKVHFDLAHWQKIAEQNGPLPEPYSDEPTQWLFPGHPRGSTAPLQVAVARLLRYHWLLSSALSVGDFQGYLS